MAISDQPLQCGVCCLASRRHLLVTLFAMFDVWPASRGHSPNRKDGQSRRASRRHSPSRSPRRAHGGTHGADDTRTWLTGNPKLDDFYEDHVVEQEAREQFGRMPQVKRKRILLDCLNRNIENPEMWIRACVRNHETQVLENTLTGMGNYRATVPSGSGSRPSPQASASTAASRGHGSERTSSSESHAPFGWGDGDRRGAGNGDTLSDDGRVTPWTLEAFPLWRERKGELLARLCQTLPTDTLETFQALTPASQASLAFAAVLASPRGDRDVPGVMASWMRRWEALQTPGSALTATPQPQEPES